MPDVQFIPDTSEPPAAQFIPDTPAPQFIPDAPTSTAPATPAVVSPEGMDFGPFQSFLNEHAKDPNHPGWKDYFRAVLNEPMSQAKGLANMVAAPGQALQATAENPVTTENAMAPARDIALASELGRPSPFRGAAPAAAEAPKPVEPTFIPDKEPVAPLETKPVAETPAKELPPITVEEPGATSAARAIKQIFSPDTVSPVAEGAAADIREAGGRAARDTETTRAALDQQSKTVSALPEPEKLNLIDYIENRSKTNVPMGEVYKGPTVSPELQPVADAIRTEMQKRVDKLQALPSIDKMDFIEDYYPHMWQDPAKAADFVRDFAGGSAKQGSGASLKKRTIPTIADGIAAGLKPISPDPITTVSRYVDSMDHFIASQQVLEKGKAEGNVKYFKPNVMGASGNPEGVQGIPKGWQPINGRGSTNAQGWKAYAPADYARVYNNYIDRGWNKSETWGPILNGVQHTSNAITSLKLGLSGFHALTMAKEAYASGIDRAVSNLASGRPLHALGDLARAPTKFLENPLVGKHLKDTYLGKKNPLFGDASPKTRQIVDLLTDAGGRLAGNRHAPDYRYSAMDSYWNTFKRGTAKAEMIAAGAEARKAYGLGSVKVLAQQVGRVMQTAAKPLFEHYIPALKNGAAYDMMSAWLDANPKADHPAQLAAARKIVDAIDDRFGEMIQDNIFWNKTMKQSLQTAMTSYSWFLGTARAIGGGTASLVRNPARLSMKHPDWKPNASYALALPFVVATSNAVYQYLKTGKSPDTIQDLMAPETGGTVAGVGQGKQVKERAQLPGYEKDVFGWLHDPKSEAYNKLAGGIKIPWELLANKDWKDQPIRHSGAPAPEQVKQVLTYILQGLNPISITKLMEGQKKGSAITKPETVGGIKNAPPYLQDPEGSSKTDKYFADKAWQKRQNWERSHAKKMQ